MSPDVAITGQLLENLPPIGVFWDIENCSVPSGRSAVAVVQRIREKFFKGHREAEFICVCDISKENKEVIEELNNCQVGIWDSTVFTEHLSSYDFCRRIVKIVGNLEIIRHVKDVLNCGGWGLNGKLSLLCGYNCDSYF